MASSTSPWQSSRTWPFSVHSSVADGARRHLAGGLRDARGQRGRWSQPPGEGPQGALVPAPLGGVVRGGRGGLDGVQRLRLVFPLRGELVQIALLLRVGGG